MLGYGYDDVSALRDMFDGGGAGQSGDEFEGGGILSLLANLLASPYGSQREMERQAVAEAVAASSPRPAPRPAPRDYRGSGATPATAYMPSEGLMSGEDVELPMYRGREEAFLLPGAFERSPQATPAMPSDPAVPSTGGSQEAKDARALANVMAGDAASMGIMAGRPAPAESGPTVPRMDAPTSTPDPVESALNMLRRGLMSSDNETFTPLAQFINSRGTPAQREELNRYLMSAAELSVGGNSPLAGP